MFELDWDDFGIDMLAELCLQHRARWADINNAVNDVESKLQTGHLAESRHIAEGLKRIDSVPVAVYFSMSGSTVSIESVRWIG